MTIFNIDVRDSFFGDYLFNRFKKNTAVVVYIQKASFTSLGYLVETEQQRQITKIISEGAQKQTDSPESQLNLHHWLFDYLNKHAQVVGSNEIRAGYRTERTQRPKQEFRSFPRAILSVFTTEQLQQ